MLSGQALSAPGIRPSEQALEQTYGGGGGTDPGGKAVAFKGRDLEADKERAAASIAEPSTGADSFSLLKARALSLLLTICRGSAPWTTWVPSGGLVTSVSAAVAVFYS